MSILNAIQKLHTTQLYWKHFFNKIFWNTKYLLKATNTILETNLYSNKLIDIIYKIITEAQTVIIYIYFYICVYIYISFDKAVLLNNSSSLIVFFLCCSFFYIKYINIFYFTIIRVGSKEDLAFFSP